MHQLCLMCKDTFHYWYASHFYLFLISVAVFPQHGLWLNSRLCNHFVADHSHKTKLFPRCCRGWKVNWSAIPISFVNSTVPTNAQSMIYHLSSISGAFVAIFCPTWKLLDVQLVRVYNWGEIMDIKDCTYEKDASPNKKMWLNRMRSHF